MPLNPTNQTNQTKTWIVSPKRAIIISHFLHEELIIIGVNYREFLKNTYKRRLGLT